MKYANEWRERITRMGRWIDFDNDYKTLDVTFMESVWWVFGQLHEKGLVYRGFKVMPYSVGCSTPLSNFEANQNYKDVNDPAVTVAMPLVSDPATSILVWTTTPWTLPSNLACCVNSGMDYVKIRDNAKKDQAWILAKSRLSMLYPKAQAYTVVEEMKGSALVGLEYTPPFDYFEPERARVKAFRVLSDNYVTDGSGTGIVHQAPAFGEDDYRVCANHGIVRKGEPLVCPVDADGCFTAEVRDYVGRGVKDCDKDIMARLKTQGRLVQAATINHSYPFCWRTDTPLIYKAVPSWFVKVEDIRDRLIANNLKTQWVPPTVREKRFGNWLENARDWAVSRNRYWGTPLPLWCSEDGEEVVCISSIAQLEKLTGATGIKDLHRESVDHLTIPSSKGKGVLRRTPEVFDCWFESGSMPYAQVHYPFEKTKEDFAKIFPADFIAEGIDQTRGWFYTLLVLSTALFDAPPFKNLVVNGLVLAADGRKMSKRLQNYPDPVEVVNRHGADALRMFLINSPVVRGEDLRFNEDGVRDCLKDVLLPWQNAYRFFVTSVSIYEDATKTKFVPGDVTKIKLPNVMDRWILSATQSLITYVKKEMAEYHLYTVIPALVKQIEALTNWYVRFNRQRLKAAGDGEPEVAYGSLSVLFEVLLTMCTAMAPFTPFLVETMYQNLRLLLDAKDPRRQDSVHFVAYPTPLQGLSDHAVEDSVRVLQRVVVAGRTARERRAVSLKVPCLEVKVVSENPQMLASLRELNDYVASELNVRNVVYTAELPGLTRSVVLDFKVLGKKCGKDMQAVKAACDALTTDQVKAFQTSGSVTVAGHTLAVDEVTFKIGFDKSLGEGTEVIADGDLIVLLDVTRDEALAREGLAREFINRAQKLRKKGCFVPTDALEVFYSNLGKDTELAKVLAEGSPSLQTIRAALQRPVAPASQQSPYAIVVVSEDQEINGETFRLSLALPALHWADHDTLAKAAAGDKALALAAVRAVATLSYPRAIAMGATISVTVDGKPVTFAKGTHFWAGVDKQ
jgi:isoleucyl-tRNA synthetase